LVTRCDHTGELERSTGRVHPDDASLFVRVRAERDATGRRLTRWKISAQSPARPDSSALVAMRASVTMPRRTDLETRGGREIVAGFTPRPRTTMSVSTTPWLVCTAVTRPSASVANDSTDTPGVQLDASPANRVGDERAHVGIERVHRLNRPFDHADLEPASMQSLGHLQTDVPTADHDRLAGPRVDMGAQLDAVADRLDAVDTVRARRAGRGASEPSPSRPRAGRTVRCAAHRAAHTQRARREVDRHDS